MTETLLSTTVKQLRKEYHLTQQDLAYKSGVGLRFVRELEQGKPTVRMDKVNQVLELFNLQLGAVPLERRSELWDKDEFIVTEQRQASSPKMRIDILLHMTRNI